MSKILKITAVVAFVAVVAAAIYSFFRLQKEECGC